MLKKSQSTQEFLAETSEWVFCRIRSGRFCRDPSVQTPEQEYRNSIIIYYPIGSLFGIGLLGLEVADSFEGARSNDLMFTKTADVDFLDPGIVSK